MKENLIFIDENELDKPIYRIFSYKRLKEIFTGNELTLVKPKLWDDPFENFILNSTGKLKDGREFQIGFRDNYYGQCWSLTKESDAMWRIYSQNKDGVKVKTTIRKLFKPFFQTDENNYKANGSEYNISTFIGKVKYSSTEKLLAMLQDKERMSNKIFDQSGWGQASSFFFKRWAFRHEKEIRLIYNEHNNSQSNLYKFNINPNQVFDEIVFDPRMNSNEYEKYKTELIKFGYSNKIIQSGLYKIRKFTIELNDNI